MGRHEFNRVLAAVYHCTAAAFEIGTTQDALNAHLGRERGDLRTLSSLRELTDCGYIEIANPLLEQLQQVGWPVTMRMTAEGLAAIGNGARPARAS